MPKARHARVSQAPERQMTDSVRNHADAAQNRQICVRQHASGVPISRRLAAAGRAAAVPGGLGLLFIVTTALRVIPGG